MPEYDTNLPQEFSHLPKRRSGVGLFVAVALLAVVVFFVFAAVRQSPLHDAAQQQTASESSAPARGE